MLVIGALACGGAAIATSGPAHAAGVCTVRAHFASRIAITADNVKVGATLTGCNGTFEYASADFYGAEGTDDILIFDQVRTAYADLYSWNVRPGTHRTIDGWGYQHDSTSIAWQYTSAVVKFGQRMSVGTSRSGSVVTITGTVAQFKAFDGYRGIGGKVVTLQQHTSSGWVSLGSVRSNSTGRATFHRTLATAAYYRLITPDTAGCFSATSAQSRR